MSGQDHEGPVCFLVLFGPVQEMVEVILLTSVGILTVHPDLFQLAVFGDQAYRAFRLGRGKSPLIIADLFNGNGQVIRYRCGLLDPFRVGYFIFF